MSSVRGHGQTSAAYLVWFDDRAETAREQREPGAQAGRDAVAAVQVLAGGGELERDQHGRDRPDQGVDLDPDEPERRAERLEVTQRRG